MSKIDTLRAASAHRTGLYADGYRIGLDVADGIITPAENVRANGKQWAQGYRDGLALRPVRVPVKGAGSASRQNARALRYWRRKNANASHA